MGHSRHVYQLEGTGKFVTVPTNWNPEKKMHHYIFYPTHDTDEGEILMHSSHDPLSEIDHMRYLHAQGFLRAVIVHINTKRWNLIIVQYHNNIPELESKQVTPAVRTPWPEPQQQRSPVSMIDFQNISPDRPSSCLDIGLDFETIRSFFHSADDVLCPWYSHLELPDFVKLGIDQLVSTEGQVFDPRNFDRLVIYTDGSSKAHNRRKAPLYVAETDLPDAWSFVVLGDMYPKTGRSGSLTFLGWHAQQIMYEQDSTAFTGTNQIGAEYAEREAMIFAGLWRLALNSTVPTFFRTDSNTTADQATGRAGFSIPHATIDMLRGIYQALDAGMEKDDLVVAHVKGHAGDIWNELADNLAKSEAMKGHHLRRQQIDLHAIGPVLPYLWMILDTKAGLPQFTQHGFNICPPSLPRRQADVAPTNKVEMHPHDRTFQLCLASLNVGSLYLSPDGFSGKLSYLRQQMQSHAIHLIGIQEARSSPGLSTVDGVLRIAGGSQNGQLGVELWVSLTQPITTGTRDKRCIKRSDVQLVHHDPRRILARIVCCNMNCFVAVLHGPQSGRPLQERRLWWEETGNILHCFCDGHPLYILMDANAKTGPMQPPIVFNHDDQTSSNTPFLIEFLDSLGHCLPCTSTIHEGSQHTWTTPDGLNEHRIDYVTIPQETLPRCTWSGIVSTLDTGHVSSDHTATAIQLTWTETISASHRAPKRLNHDRSKIQHCWDKLDFSNFTAEEWMCDIETQVQKMNTSFHSALQEACPLIKTQPKKSFIDDQTWQLRATKLGLRKRLQHAKRQSRFDLLSKLFQIWRGTNQDVTPFVHHETTVLCGTLKLSCEYWRCSKQLKQRLQKLKTNALQAVIADSGSQASAGALLHVLKPFIGSTNPKKQKQASLPIVRQSDGTICATPLAAQNRWIEFFQAIEGGQRMTHSEARDLWIDNLQGFLKEVDIHLQVQEMPTLCELEAAFRRVPVGKAIGMDEVPPELCHFCPAQLAKICYPLLLKAAVYGQEAHEHKGGQLAIAWKRRGDVRDCQTHRSLLRWKQQENRPTAVVFLDLTEAFYRTLRPLAVGGTCSDHCISLMCHKLGLESDAFQDLCRLLQEPSALAEAKAPRHVQRMLQAIHTDTWFKLGQQTDIVRTEIGSRPGDSFADVVFGLPWAKLLQKLEKRLVAQGILEYIPDIEYPTPFSFPDHAAAPRIPLLGPTWMDDLSVLITAPTNAELISKTQIAISYLLDSCLDFQMEPNLKKGKTEVMFTFKGPQSRDFRRKYFSDKACVPIVCERQTFEISVVPRYLHLGGLIHHRDITKQEIKRRLAIANQAFQQHRRVLYRNKNVDWKIRCDIFNTLVLSKFLYGLESWTFKSQQMRSQIHKGIMKLYRRLLGASHDAHLTDLDVLVATEMPDPTELLRRTRLRYFGTIHNCKNHAHWGLLQEDTEWVSLMRDDLHWLWTQIGQAAGLGDPCLHFPQWQDLIIHHGVFWKKLIRRGIRHACLQRKKEYHAVELHQKVGTLLKEVGLVSELPSQRRSSPSPEDDRQYGCMQCQRHFASLAGESVHMCKTHRLIASERFLFDGTHCPCCLREFHTHSKVLAHLRHVSRCKETLRNRLMTCPPAPGHGSLRDQELADLHDGALPLMQSQGPSLPDPVPRVWDSHDIVFLEAIYLHLLDSTRECTLEETMRGFISAYPISWTKCKITLQAFCDQLTQEDAEVLCWAKEEIISCISRLADAKSWPFLYDPSAAPYHETPADICDWEDWCKNLDARPPAEWMHWTPLPKALTRHKILLHAFAGRRRKGDVEWYLDIIAQDHPGCVISTVSLDIIIDRVHGDIANPTTRAMWLNYIRQGFVAGFLAGPPCNTWSKVRSVQLSDKKGPRVIRTPDAPWGLNELKMGELFQVTIGTILLGFSIECMLAISLSAGSGILEHPKDSDDDNTVSIWRLPIMRMLLQLPWMRQVHLSQGLFGASSPKPTTLLVVGMPKLEQILHAGMLSNKLQYGQSTGKDAKGNFHTAPLKEYPPGFCMAMAQCFALDFCTPSTCTECGTACDMPSSFLNLCQHMQDHDFGKFIGKD